jgi:hypothetical protein
VQFQFFGEQNSLQEVGWGSKTIPRGLNLAHRKRVFSFGYIQKYLDAKVGIEVESKTCFPILKDIVQKDNSSIYGYTLCRFVCPNST